MKITQLFCTGKKAVCSEMNTCSVCLSSHTDPLQKSVAKPVTQVSLNFIVFDGLKLFVVKLPEK